MRQGSILLESIVFLVLSLLMFFLIFNGVERMWNRQRQIERNSIVLSLMLSIRNVERTGDVPENLKTYMGDYSCCEKMQSRQYNDSNSGSDDRVHDIGGNDF